MQSNKKNVMTLQLNPQISNNDLAGRQGLTFHEVSTFKQILPIKSILLEKASRSFAM